MTQQHPLLKNARLIAAGIAVVFAAGGLGTRIFMTIDQTRLTMEQTRLDQIEGDKAIVESIDKQTESIRDLTSTLADHEARLRVNEIHIRDLREKSKNGSQ